MALSVIMSQVVNSFLYVRVNKRKALSLLTGLFCLSFSSNAQHELRGLVFEHDRYNALPLITGYGKREGVPPSASLERYLPRVVNQANLNSGVAWSTVWYAHTILEASSRKIERGAENHNALPLSPAFTYRMVAGPGCAEAVSLVDVLESLSRDGSPRFSEHRSLCADVVTDDLKRLAQRNRLPGYARLFNTYDPGDTKVNEIKKALNSGTPVVVGMICPPSLALAEAFWQPRELEVDEKDGGHVLTVVGYDDAKYGGAFRVVNTWGTRWADNGLTWIRYADVSRHFLYGFTLLGPGFPLEASITFATTGGKAMPVAIDDHGRYQLKDTYRTGDKFNIDVATRNGIFFNAVVKDGSGASAVIFPADTMIVPFVGREHWLPGAATYFTLTDPPGDNTLYFIFADHQDKLQVVVNGIMKGQPCPQPNPEFSRWASDKIQFESTENIVVVSVVLRQR